MPTDASLSRTVGGEGAGGRALGGRACRDPCALRAGFETIASRSLNQRATPRLRALRVVDQRPRAVRRERHRAGDDGGDQPPGRPALGVDLHLDDIRGLHHGRPGRRAGQDHIARLEGHQLGQVRDDLLEREQQVGGRVLLHKLVVDPGAHTQCARVDLVRWNQGGADRGEAVAALRPHVGALVGPAQVVHAEVVTGRHGCNRRPRRIRMHASRARADDQGDLALEGEQLASVGPLDRLAARTERRRRLQEVAGRLRCATALGGAARIVEVHGDDLAGAVPQERFDAGQRFHATSVGVRNNIRSHHAPPGAVKTHVESGVFALIRCLIWATTPDSMKRCRSIAARRRSCGQRR